MSKQTETSLFMVSSVPRLYQQLLSGVASYQALGNRIVKQIKTAQAFRHVEYVRELSKILINIPIKEYKLIAQYYFLWCDCRESKFDTDALEVIIEQSQTYKAQALSSRAAFEGYKGNPESAARFYLEGLKTRHTASEHIGLKLGIAMIKSMEGFHASALKDMEQLIPVIHYAEPQLFYNLLNSYATEVGTAGRLYEARNISRFVLASPFAFAYREWRETAEELRLPRRSMVALRSPDSNVLALPEREASEQPSTQPKPAQVFNFAKLRKKILRKMKKQDEEKSVYQMSTKDMGFKLLELITDQRASEAQMRTLLLFALKLFYGYDEPPDKPSA
jgi:hypothetical protein